MGNAVNGQNKDGYIDIIVQLNKPIYTAGEFVDGAVHINCKDSRNYRSARIKLEGKQHNYWTQGSSKHRRRYSNTKQTYLSSFDLAIFANGIINAGQYTFPFRFLLSKQLCGSIYESDNCYIRYFLSAELVPADDKNTIQSFTKLLNVIEPPRLPFGPTSLEQITNPQSGCCCCCCRSDGTVKINMTADKNFVKPGDTVNVSGTIDNRNGKKAVKNLKIHFLQKIWRVSSTGVTRNHITTDHILYHHKNPVQEGQTDQFNCSVIIPKGLVYSSAIGSILSKYHTLSIKGDMGGCCCPYDIPRCQLSMVFHTDSQKIQNTPKIQAPSIWKPMIASEVVCTSMAPYIYQPNPKLPTLNRQNGGKLANLANFNNMLQNTPMNNMNQMNQMGQMNELGQMGLKNHMNQMNNINTTQQNLFDNQRNNTEYLPNY